MQTISFRYYMLLMLFCVSGSSFAQQNFFNVPSSDITQHKKSFFQQQINAVDGALQFNSTYNYGLGKGFEIGVNYLGFSVLEDKNLTIPLNDAEEPYNPFLMLNAQKRWDLSEHIGMAVGAQFGATTTLHTQTGGYAFSNFTYAKEDIGLKLVGGLYAATNSLFGEGDRLFLRSPVGFQAGIEQAIIKEKLVFQADFISGQHNLGELVLGGAYYLSKDWILSAGYQIPTMGSNSINAVVVEFTYNPK